jgi:signal transduction histidine kinase/CheY-like chemotaxis protein
MSFTAILVLTIALTIITLNEYVNQRQETQKQLIIIGDLVAWNAISTLAFNDNKAAQDLMTSFKYMSNIVAVTIVDSKLAEFASYHASNLVYSTIDGHELYDAIQKNQGQALEETNSNVLSELLTGILKLSATADKELLNSNSYYARLISQPRSIQLVRPILLDGDLLGILCIEDDQSELYKVLYRFYIIISLVMVLMSLLIVLISTRLQNVFLSPLLLIISAMSTVKEQKTFSVRMPDEGHDEFSEMAKTFNSMLDEIESLDKSLVFQRDNLEVEVQIRTAELREYNHSLNTAIQNEKIARRHAEVANQAKSLFLATMSHEIRTPITSVLGLLELLNKTRMDAKQTDLAYNAFLSGQFLLSLINNILDLSKIESGKIELHLTEFNLVSLVQDIQIMMNPQAQDKQLSLVTNINYKSNCAIIADEDRLKQVLCNLINNAIKFTEQGDISLSVTYQETALSEYDNVMFEVRDTGIGISADKLTLIFKSFTQADGSITRQYGGSGLGLSISKELVTLMGGTLAVDSVIDQGSCFYFSLKLLRAKQSIECLIAPMDVKANNSTPLALTSIDLKTDSSSTKAVKGIVLLVDDKPVNQQVVTYMLQDLNYQVESVLSGLDALLALQHHSFKLILMDCHMPVMDGFETSKRIREIESKNGQTPTTIIALTADVQSGVAERCFKAGMNDYLSKPFNLKQLEAKLSKWVEV